MPVRVDAAFVQTGDDKLGKKRGVSVKQFMLDKGVPEERIKIISRGKLDAIAPVTDLVGMQKDRNAQFMIAEVEEIEIPAPSAEAKPLEEGKYMEEQKQHKRIVQKPYFNGRTVSKTFFSRFLRKNYIFYIFYYQLYAFGKRNFRLPS